MPLQAKARSRVLYMVGGLIALLLCTNTLLMYRNSKVISHNKQLQDDAEKAKVSTLDIIRNLHLLDIGLRGYALTQNPKFLSSCDSAKFNKEKIFLKLERALIAQRFPELKRLSILHDSVNRYFAFVDKMLALAQAGKFDEVSARIEEDRGYALWLHYRTFSQTVNNYEDTIAREAEQNYQAALQNSYLLQLLLFLTTVPAVAYMAFYASRTFRISQQLQATQAEKNNILAEQNKVLDRLVQEKTEDILAQNEEIVAQNEEIRAHNDQLILQQQEIERSKQIIEEQSQTIAQRNANLTKEVERQTQELLQTNSELIAHNSRLQQFTYIISHNLRAPLARLKGLANIMEHSSSQQEKDQVYKLMVQSSYELEHVITDLSTILSIQNSNTLVKSPVNVHQVLQKVLTVLTPEIKQVSARLTVNVDTNTVINSFAPYLESIFYNLISNSIKYRDPDRPLEISITQAINNGERSITIRDNGLGIDLDRHRENLFNLYKRFHLHVEGKGLGLYLAKTQAEALGGRIDVQSTVNTGSTFAVYFPKD